MGCNCGKKRVNIDEHNIEKAKKGSMSSRIKKIWKLSEDGNIVVKKINNK